MINDALRHGVTELLLAPWTYLGDPELQARTIAADIATMRDDYGIRITTTGVVNEPGAGERKIVPPADFVPLAIAMRRELDARGLKDVKVIGPEWSSADDNPVQWFDAIAANPQALAAVAGLATHSYGMAANRELAERVLAHHKQYWMTEAGGGDFDGSAEFAYALRGVGLVALPERPQRGRRPLGVVHRAQPRHPRRLPEARDVRGPLRQHRPDLQELQLPPRPADHDQLPARHGACAT